MDPENLENPQVLVVMTMLQSSLSHHHLNRLVCLGFFCRIICFMLGSSLRYSWRFLSFCDNPLALVFVEDDELFSLFASFFGVAGAMAFVFSKRCRL